MCGIFVSFNNTYTKEILDECLHLMDHRGPDYSNSVIGDDYYFGHNRLSIIDLNPRSNQPFEKASHIMVYNGEVYNYLELIKEHHLNVETSSDTEVVLEMYIKYKEKCLQYFNGMFAFIILNKKTKDTFIARDRLGIKPLYYYNSGRKNIFSSEIASILNIVNDGFDEFGIRQYRKLRMTLKGYTIYNNIKMFEAGHYAINGKITKYWDLDITEKLPPSDDELKNSIIKSIELRKRSDVPVGSYLSGGLDSTIVSLLLEPDDTWTVGFNELNEFKWGDIANKKLSSNYHKINITRKQFIESLSFMVDKRKEPLSVPNEVMLYFMTREVKKRNTVVLSGEGADELFFGYDRIFKWAYNNSKFQLSDFDKKYCYGSNKDDEIIDFAIKGLPGKSLLDKIAYFFQIYHLQGLLRRVDNSTMLCSVEARVPFVDHNLVEMMAGTPFSWRMGNSIKAPLKRAFKTLVPKIIINRKKIGFPAPLDTIFDAESYQGNKPMDRWLIYNLKSIGYNIN